MGHDRHDTPTAKAGAENGLPPQRGAADVPLPGMVATRPAGIDKAFAEKTVVVDSRIFDASADQVFSAVIDAMTALNIPVQRVDSPHGVISTEWIFLNADRTTITLQKGKRITIRYRLLVRIFRNPDNARSQVEIRTLAQQRNRDTWTRIRLRRKVSLELFDAVREQLVRTGSGQHDRGALIQP